MFSLMWIGAIAIALLFGIVGGFLISGLFRGTEGKEIIGGTAFGIIFMSTIWICVANVPFLTEGTKKEAQEESELILKDGVWTKDKNVKLEQKK